MEFITSVVYVCVSVRVCACTQLTELMVLFYLCDFL